MPILFGYFLGTLVQCFSLYPTQKELLPARMLFDIFYIEILKDCTQFLQLRYIFSVIVRTLILQKYV
jgi:hypothetical protein